jgi:hypothetical protein
MDLATGAAHMHVVIIKMTFPAAFPTNQEPNSCFVDPRELSWQTLAFTIVRSRVVWTWYPDATSITVFGVSCR